MRTIRGGGGGNVDQAFLSPERIGEPIMRALGQGERDINQEINIVRDGIHVEGKRGKGSNARSERTP